MASPLIAGNWKMNLTEKEALSLVRKIMQGARRIDGVDILLFPPFTCLSQLHKLLISSPISLGTQNISQHPQGAYTGGISARMAGEFCTHVLVGHSERRQLYGETDALVNRKIRAALSEGLIPVLCVGEQEEERKSGKTTQVISDQLQRGLQGIQILDSTRLIIAYEPVWAIGTGQSAAPADAAEVIGKAVKPVLGNLWGESTAREIRVLYGGSMNPANAAGFLSQSEFNGGLIGGASLSANSFLEIISSADRYS